MKLNNYMSAEGLEANLLGKLEFFNPAGSVKDRVAKKMIEDAENQVSQTWSGNNRTYQREYRNRSCRRSGFKRIQSYNDYAGNNER